MTTKKIMLGKNYYTDLKKLLPFANSKFTNVKVAAIIVTDKGVFKGVNYEDPILNLGICAERNAIFNAITNGMKQIYEVHLFSNIDKITMCGACRQLLSTFIKPTGKVYIYHYKTGKRNVKCFKEYLPFAAPTKF